MRCPDLTVLMCSVEERDSRSDTGGEGLLEAPIDWTEGRGTIRLERCEGERSPFFGERDPEAVGDPFRAPCNGKGFPFGLEETFK